jgi:anthranilate phosphoribosyltransferase
MLDSTLGHLAAGEDLSLDEMSAAVDAIMQGRCSAGEIGLLLTGLRLKGETVEEVAGAALAMRRHMTPIRSSREGIVDTCGTGGDGSATFNISTAAALVTAAAGVPVAKHGNRRVTSRTGSADVLQHLGVNIEADVGVVEACLDELGICFCFAPLLHPAMKQVAEVRRQLGVPTIFNLLGPLTNPASAPFQMIGVGRPELRGLLAEALGLIGTQRAIVVRGDDGLDEVTLAGPTQVSVVGPACRAGHGGGEDADRHDASRDDADRAVPPGRRHLPREFTWQPEDFGLRRSDMAALRVEGPEQSAAVIRAVLDGQPGPARDITVLNSAAALWTAGKDESPRRCAELAAVAIDSGAARELLARLTETTGRTG